MMWSRWSKRGITALMTSFVVFVMVFRSLRANEYKSYLKPSVNYFASQPSKTTLDLSFLSEYSVSAKFTYARRLIKTEHFYGERPILNTIKEPLFPSPQLIQNVDLSSQEITELPPLTLHVPSSPDIDLSIMSFGAATSIPRLNASIPQLSHWLSNTTCPVHVVSPPHNSTLDIESLIRDQPININLTVTTSEMPVVQAYFSLVKHLYDSRTPKTEWLVLIDDDTFVPSLPYLVSHLSQNYDSTKPQLIAAMSDDIVQIRTFGVVPFGGAGIFMSLPLAKILASPEVYDNCIDSSKSQGDQIFNDCLVRYTYVKPIFDHGLNQMDIKDPPDGYFESGRRMLTVHHWKSWFSVDVPAAAKVSKATGNEGVFMRWLFDDGVVLSNGFSIVDYGDEVNGVELEKVEKTWPGESHRFLHHIGPLRNKLADSEKRSFRLVEAEILTEGVRQIYLHTATSAEGGVNRFLELLWLF